MHYITFAEIERRGGSKHQELWMYNMEVPKPNKLGFRESMVRMMALIMGNSTLDVHFLDS